VPLYCAGGSQAGPHALVGKAGFDILTQVGPQPAKFHFSKREASAWKAARAVASYAP
jgi:hypothetical protein